jgi:hypothetical protein
MLRHNIRVPRWFNYGNNPILEEDWDEYYAPPITTATCFKQFEGVGRNDFGPEIKVPWVSPSEQKLQAYKSGIAAVIAAPVVIIPPPPPLPPFPWPMYDEPLPAKPFRLFNPIFPDPLPPEIPKPPKDKSPLRPFCYVCGWRQGGPDSWCGFGCKCGIAAPPMVSARGNFFYK